MRLLPFLLLALALLLADLPEAAAPVAPAPVLRPLPSSRGNRPPAAIVASAASVRPTATPPATATPSPTATVGPRLTELGVFRVTGYSNGPRNGVDGLGITRSGEPTRWGVVAVDMAVIPLGTRLRIDGFGEMVFTALDTGGLVIGRHIDVFWPTDRAAINWGMQYKRVWRRVE